MEYVLIVVLGFAGGAFCTFIGFDVKRRKLNAQGEEQTERIEWIKASWDELGSKETRLEQQVKERKEQLAKQAARVKADLEAHRESAVQVAKQKEDQVARAAASEKAEIERRTQHSLSVISEKQVQSLQLIAEREQQSLQLIDEKQKAMDSSVSEFRVAQKQFDSQIVSYKELQQENLILKRDLANLAIHVRKCQLDGQQNKSAQVTLDERVRELGARYLKENVKWIGTSLNASNFASCKQRLLTVIQRCRDVGFSIPEEEEVAYVAELRSDFEKIVRAALEREEQARIKALIREEQQREREIQRELDKIERERAVIEAALSRALAEAHDQHSSEIESLKARLADAEAQQRAVSQAQLTKAGHIYVISNIGSFGDGIYKIGMTRRLDPLERVRELGDASVPFPFDVHMVISCENAPSLENAIHRRLLKQQINKTNPRKEFFKAEIQEIVEVVRAHHGEVSFVADAEALQYRQSLTMSDDDQEFIEHTFDEAEADLDLSSEDADLVA